MRRQKSSNLTFINLLQNNQKSLTEKSGRFLNDEGKEKKIIKDIIKKLNLLDNKKDFLDIGCGFGYLTDLIIKFSRKKKINLTLCDIKHVIQKLKKKYKNIKNIKFIESEFQKYNFSKKKYDRILIYSAIQYVDNPKIFIKKAFNLLKNDGQLLIGDIPNVNKKYRFLKSNFGKKFEKKRRNLDDLNLLTKNIRSFLKNTKQNLEINDKFIFWLFKTFQKKGANVYLFNQPKKLPFSFTRDDVLIQKL